MHTYSYMYYNICIHQLISCRYSLIDLSTHVIPSTNPKPQTPNPEILDGSEQPVLRDRSLNPEPQTLKCAAVASSQSLSHGGYGLVTLARVDGKWTLRDSKFDVLPLVGERGYTGVPADKPDW
jgi:hypothetical protein